MGLFVCSQCSTVCGWIRMDHERSSLDIIQDEITVMCLRDNWQHIPWQNLPLFLVANVWPANSWWVKWRSSPLRSVLRSSVGRAAPPFISLLDTIILAINTQDKCMAAVGTAVSILLNLYKSGDDAIKIRAIVVNWHLLTIYLLF